ncbi:MAG: cold shock domain-containing protein, partial [Tannerellaceae bacterium]|nr:cold shock domain-containing protein [Tannerellaceae bacterium]
MFDIFKKDIRVGDKVKLYLTTGKEPEGIVVEIGDNFVLLQSDDQTLNRFFDKLIGGWELIVNTKSEKQVEQVKKDDIPIVEQISEVASSTSTPVTNKPITEYKVGEKIPLELLSKITDKKNKVSKIKGKPKSTFKSFDALEQLISPEEKRKLEDEAKIDDEKILSANGVITKYFADRNFGFIVDKFGYEIYFHFGDIVDENLSKSLKFTSTKLQLPVIFTLSKNSKGDKAVLIHKPEKVGVIIEKIKKLSENKDFNSAIGLIEQILSSFPNNKLATQLKKDFNSKNKPWGFNTQKIKSYDLNYQKAVKAKNIDKDFNSALKYYMLAFDNNEKRESCIKDIGMLHVSMGEPQEALDFINEYEHELQNNITTYNYLTNFYSSVKEFDKVIEYIDLLIENKSVAKDKRKMSLYLSQKGFALIQKDKKDEARNVLDEALGYMPDNTYVTRLLQALDEPDEEKQSQIIAEAEFDSFGGGLSKFI